TAWRRLRVDRPRGGRSRRGGVAAARAGGGIGGLRRGRRGLAALRLALTFVAGPAAAGGRARPGGAAEPARHGRGPPQPAPPPAGPAPGADAGHATAGLRPGPWSAGAGAAGVIPLRATARVQLHAGFTLRDVAQRVPYYAALGISHLYLSPIGAAVAG